MLFEDPIVGEFITANKKTSQKGTNLKVGLHHPAGQSPGMVSLQRLPEFSECLGGCVRESIQLKPTPVTIVTNRDAGPIH